jgi:hypothetical protein
LHEIALDHLIIPATSAYFERQFSQAKSGNGDRRRSMSEEKLSSMVFVSSNMAVAERVLRENDSAPPVPPGNSDREIASDE